MRYWHRWAAIPAGLLLFFIALTGVLLHFDMIRVGHAPPGHEPPDSRPVRPLPSNAELGTIIGRAGGDMPGTASLAIDGETGAVLHEAAPPADYHFLLKDLHAGYMWGWTGRVISILTGIALLVLSATGLKLWWDMRRRGRKGIYWK